MFRQALKSTDWKSVFVLSELYSFYLFIYVQSITWIM